MSGDCAVYYAINDVPKYVFFARRSIASLRDYNKTIPIHLFVYGSASAFEPDFLERYRVYLHEGPKPSPHTLTSLKWEALEPLTEFRLLFADADTFFFGDPMQLLGACTEADYYAREEVGTERGSRLDLIGNALIYPQLDHRAFSRLAKTLKAAELPVFNTGIMILNHGIREKIVAHLDLIRFLRTQFLEKRLAYPCGNWHIIDEVVASLVLGRISDLRCARLSKALSPWYIELKGGEVSSPGIVLHTWSDYYPFFLRDREGQEALEGSPVAIKPGDRLEILPRRMRKGE